MAPGSTSDLSVEQAKELKIPVYSFRPKVTAQFFNLLVDGETVSCQDIMWTVFRGEHPGIDNVQVPDEFVETFKKMHHSMRQQIAYCALEALAFYTLLKG